MDSPSQIIEKVEEQVSRLQRFWAWFVSEIKWCVRVVLSSCDRFYWDNGFSKAASLAYTTLLSLVPVTALGFSILASFVAKNETVPELRNFIARVFRQFAPSVEAVDTVIAYLNDFSRTIAGLNELAIVFLVITSLLLLNSIEYALNEIWQVYEARSLPHRIARFCAILVIAPVLAVSGYYTSLRFRFQPLFDDYGVVTTLYTVYDYLMPFLVDFVAFVFLYYLVPKAPVRFSSAAFGAFLAAILFGVAKELFAIYVLRFSSHAAIYGTLATIPIFLFWLYLAWTILLLGAESCYQAQYLPRSGKIWKRSVLSVGDGTMLLAMQAMVMVARAFERGEKMPGELEIAERLGCSSVLLKPAIDHLERARIIIRGDSRDMPLTLLRSPEKITVNDIREALFKHSDASMHFPEEMTRVFQSVRAATDSGKLTLAEIIQES
ncbi:MAG: YihY family inner membrane protein [Deltaproteobacteria bacterium]|nr:YihY family inner membrane protein [Deltaproteobacteria bacterium]